MSATISIQTLKPGDEIRTERGPTMKVALRRAVLRAHSLASEDCPDLFLYDCIGGLRCEVRWRDGASTARFTR